MNRTEKLKNTVNRFFSPRLRMRIYSIPFMICYQWFIKGYDNSNPDIFKYIEIETINRCNGTCSFCPVNATLPQRPFYKMSESVFYKIIDELGELHYKGELRLYSNNEPFLDDRIITFAQYAKSHLEKAFICIYTNGTLLSVPLVKEICEFIDMLVIDDYSDDGMTISDNLVPVIEYCKEHKNIGKKVIYVKRNKKEVLTSRGGQAPNFTKLNNIQRYKGCFLPFKQMVIRPDGKCSLCCNDALGRYTLGDVTEQTLIDIWQSDRYVSIRKKMIEEGRKSLELCEKCDTHIIV
jgi:radical SAM protein with 4Fe4S-binding SPASM domain